MVTRLTVCVWGAVLLAGCAASGTRPRSAAAVAPSSPPSPAASDSGPAVPDLFRRSVRPVLSRRCGACHDPGGKMYERLPFDDPDVVLSKSESILRRLKEPEEKRAFEEWAAAVPQ